MLRSVQASGQCHVYVSDATAGFREGLGLTGADTTYRSYPRFVLAALIAAVRGGGWMFAFNPGEIRCVRKQAVMHALLVPTLIVGRLRGGSVVRAGVGTRDWHWFWGRLIKLTVTLASINAWRDEYSRSVFGSGIIRPDWAFDDGPGSVAPTTSRSRLAVTLRSDRPAPSEAWVAALRQVCADTGLAPVVVVQVRRDNAAAEALAARLGAEFVPWPAEQPHLRQETAVRAIYAESAFVVSDRLHALVMGLTEGALPAGVIEGPDVKIGRHFAAAGITAVSTDATGWNSARVAEWITALGDRRGEIETGLARAQQVVQITDAEIAALAG
ncbi:MAG: polysaccharide pyruvyl transferase family protein [Jatrophihabitans sp.]|nr:polysaccharide pyruvyl transferase family protein [Jatrophihabitans sp.]